MRHLLLTPILLLVVVLGYAGGVLGLAVLCYVAGPVGLAGGLFAAFLALWLPGQCRPFDDSGR